MNIETLYFALISTGVGCLMVTYRDPGGTTLTIGVVSLIAGLIVRSASKADDRKRKQDQDLKK